MLLGQEVIPGNEFPHMRIIYALVMLFPFLHVIAVLATLRRMPRVLLAFEPPDGVDVIVCPPVASLAAAGESGGPAVESLRLYIDHPAGVDLARRLAPVLGMEVSDLTDLLDLTAWPAGMRVIARKERPHPGAQLRMMVRASPW